MFKTIKTNNAPAAIGPYVQGMMAGEYVFTSGQIPINPETGFLIKKDIIDATTQALENCKSILNQAGCGLDKVVKVEIFLSDMNDFSLVNKVYSSYFKEHLPARSAVEVSKLPLNALVEIQMIGYLGK